MLDSYVVKSVAIYRYFSTLIVILWCLKTDSYIVTVLLNVSFRLWGDHGQSALESACVCLVNVSAVGTEILKNMILPGSFIGDSDNRGIGIS